MDPTYIHQLLVVGYLFIDRWAHCCFLQKKKKKLGPNARHICRVQDIPPRILDMRVRKQYDGQPMSLVGRKKNAEVERTEDRVDRKMGPNAQVLESTTQVIKARSYSFSFLIVFCFCLFVWFFFCFVLFFVF